VLITKAQAAIRYGTSRQNIGKRCKLGTIPVVRTGDGKELIDTAQADALFGMAPPPPTGIKREVRPLPDPKREQVREYVRACESVPELAESRARVEFLKAELLEMDRREKEGALVRADEVRRQWTEVTGIIRTKVLAVPSKAKQRIPDLPQGAVGILEDIVREVLEELANGDG
jgi:hypothetical protein